MSSLQDQLLKAGLTTNQKLKQNKTEKRKSSKKIRKGQAEEDGFRDEVAKQLLQKKQKDKALNLRIQENEKMKSAKANLLQMFEQHSLDNINGDLEFNFDYQGIVKKLRVKNEVHKGLIAGSLGIGQYNNKFYVLPSVNLLKLSELDESLKVYLYDRKANSEEIEDDPYANYQIPDDLMW